MSKVKDFFTPRNVAGEKVTLIDIINAPYFRLATLTTIAGTLAYFIGANLPMVSGVTAAITAIVSVRHTFHDSIQGSFLQILGVVIGDQALVHLPFGGIYLIGGVARAMQPYFDRMDLARHFRDKGRFAEFMGNFSVEIVEDDDAMPVSEEGVCRSGANVSGATGEEDRRFSFAHRVILGA